MSRPGQEGGPGDHGADLALTGPPAPSLQTRPSPLPPVTTNSLLAHAFCSRPASTPGSVSGIPGVEQCWSPAPSRQGEGRWVRMRRAGTSVDALELPSLNNYTSPILQTRKSG